MTMRHLLKGVDINVPKRDAVSSSDLERDCLGAVVFGEVIEGMDVIKKIDGVQTDRMDKPVNPVKIADCGEL